MKDMSTCEDKCKSVDLTLKGMIEDPKDLAAEKQEELGKMLKDVLTVRAAIREKHPKGEKFVADVLPCPICKEGTVDFMISDHSNGHIHGRCSTPGCVRWVE